MASASIYNLRESLRADTVTLQHIGKQLSDALAVRNEVHAAFMDADERVQQIHSQYEALRHSVVERQAGLRIMATNALPDDVLAEIFLHTVSGYSGIPHWQPGPTVQTPRVLIDRTRAKTPWKLAMVSKRWWAVAMHTPRLWSYIALRDYGGKNRPRKKSYTARMLRLSKSCPIDVAIYVANVDDNEDEEYDETDLARKVHSQHTFLGEIFELLYANSSRIRTLQIMGTVNNALDAEVADNYYAEDVRELAAGFGRLPTPALEEACLAFSGGIRLNDELWGSSIRVTFPDAPRLKYLRLDHVPMVCDTLHPGFPSLEALAITDFDCPMRDIARILTLCPGLRDLYLDLENPGVDAAELTWSLPPFRSLTLKDWGLKTFVDLAATGSLGLSKVTSLGVSTAILPNGLFPLLGGQLTTFAAIGGALRATGIMPLASLTNAEHISISTSKSTYITLLDTISRDEHPFWPKLRHFEIFQDDGFEDRGDRIIYFVKARAAMAALEPPKVVAVEKITVSKSNRVATWVIAQLRALLGNDNVVLLE